MLRPHLKTRKNLNEALMRPGQHTRWFQLPRPSVQQTATRLACLLLLLVIACAAVTPRSDVPRNLPQQATFDTAGLKRLVDSIVTDELRRTNMPGAAVVFVRDGKTVFERGYGVANLATKAPVTSQTIFRIGSISKVMTAVAVMQLADRGAIDLSVDVNNYLQRLKIPEAFGAPVTSEHLITHTAGLDEIRPGTQTSTADSVLSLPDFLRPRLQRVRRPGEFTSYSTYAPTVAGMLVEDRSGMAFEAYMRERIWRPLGMERTSITVPASLASQVSPGYERARDSSIAPQPWEWYHTTPASSMNSTTSDMARFIAALLPADPAADTPLMSAQSRQFMLRQHATMNPRLPGFAIGFYEEIYGKQRFLLHGGNMLGYSAQLVLIPDDNSGFFIVTHSEQSGLRDFLTGAIIQKLYPRSLLRHAVPPIAKPDSARLARFAGRYAWSTSCRSCTPRRVSMIMPITVNSDGTLGYNNKRWMEVGPLLFVREDGASHIAFREDEKGVITNMSAGGFWTFDRLQ
jgi:CubicO group peptidase (beta-lactamase class C family)